MKTRIIAVAVITFLALSIQGSVFASGNHGDSKANITTFATIVLNLNHYPSDSEKQKLMGIARSSHSSAEKIIATAMINLHHSASSGDKKQLKKVINDNNVSNELRDIASIIFSLTHKPNSADKDKLMTMID